MSMVEERRRALLRLAGACGVWTVAPRARAAEEVPAPPQREPLVVTGATLHPVSGPSLPGGRMWVDGGRIKAVLGADDPLPAAAAAARRLELAGRHVYPGFIAANTSLGLVEVNSVRATLDTTETGAVNPHARAVVAVNADSELIPVARTNGVLAALTVPLAGRRGLISGTSALIQLDGWNWQDMALVPEVGLHVHLPSMRLTRHALPALSEPLLDELRRSTNRRLRLLDDSFESARAYSKLRQSDPSAPWDARWEAMRPVFEQQRPVFVHADELAQIRHALGLAERFELRLVIVGGADAWRMPELLRQRGVPVIVAGVHELPRRRDDDVDTPFRLPARLAQAGVQYCISRVGGERSASNERNLPYEAATAAAHGLAPEEALKAITLHAARILGADDRLGSLQPGRLASFIVTDGDPLETTTRIERLYVQGREVDPGNRQRRLERKYEQRYRSGSSATR
ncbi:MAG: amidohydrolase family protein [Aquabacterium sp.]|nr:amidohydrolase family protein [Aquabacterium sp.]